MILFTVLTIVLIALAVILAVALAGVGSGIILLFGDVIVFAIIVRAIVKLIKRKRGL